MPTWYIIYVPTNYEHKPSLRDELKKPWLWTGNQVHYLLRMCRYFMGKRQNSTFVGVCLQKCKTLENSYNIKSTNCRWMLTRSNFTRESLWGHFCLAASCLPTSRISSFAVLPSVSDIVGAETRERQRGTLRGNENFKTADHYKSFEWVAKIVRGFLSTRINMGFSIITR